MKLTRIFALATLVAASSLSPIHAEETGNKLSADEVAGLLEKLRALQSSITGNFSENQGNAIDRFRQAASSEKAAIDFYLRCIEELDFTRNDARNSDFREWKERNETRITDDAFVTAMRVQLQYLIISIQAQRAEDIGDILPDLVTTIKGATDAAISIDEFDALDPKKRGRNDDGDGRGRGRNISAIRLLQQPVNQTPFAKAYNLDQSLKLEDWEWAPLNVAKVYDSTILPYYKENAPEKVAAAWEDRIGLEKALARGTMELAPYNQFIEQKVPELEWRRANEIFALGYQQKGAVAMLKILTDHPTHPSAINWITEMESTVVETFNADEETPADTAPPATTTVE